MTDSGAPRKFVAHREIGHVRLQWFPPERDGEIKSYELYRADGFDKPASRIAEVTGTSYIDGEVQPDHAYYYHVVAVDARGRRSRPSNEDNAKALSKPRLYDAEIVAHTVPASVRQGEPVTVTVEIKNTGSRSWDIAHPERLRFWLQTSQLWGSREETKLPQIAFGEGKVIAPGQSVTVSFPYVGPRTGRFENHWVMRLAATDADPKTGKPVTREAWFGTPLLVETVVLPRTL